MVARQAHALKEEVRFLSPRKNDIAKLVRQCLLMACTGVRVPLSGIYIGCSSIGRATNCDFEG